MEVRVGSTRVGVVVGAGTEVETGLVVVRDGCVAMSVEESSPVGKPCGAHAVQTTRIKREISDFIFVLLRSIYVRVNCSTAGVSGSRAAVDESWKRDCAEVLKIA
jgi:hypothetical protein